ncbi:MAG: methyl-accepting chemotaxis protein [Sporomusaceae bacterium]|jgi:methyl-accepting chemotaxis protein|nr:methyl-accepting chemotaxis protein [Sporomusaceae bacterium]
MGWFANLKIKAKLMTGYLILCVLLAVVGLMGLNGMGSMEETIVSLNADILAGINNIKTAQASLEHMRLITQRIVIPDFRNNLSENEQAILDTGKIIDSSVAAYEAAITQPEDRVMFDEFKKRLAAARDQRTLMIQIVNSGDYAAANDAYLNKFTPAILLTVEQLDKIIVWNENAAKVFVANAEATYSSSVTTMTSIIVGGIIIALILGFIIARSIEQPIKKLVDVSNEVASGNLRHSVTAKTTDEIGMLEVAIGKMVENLRTVITNVQSSSELVAASSEELTASADQSAQAANSVATSVMSVSQGADRTLNIVGEAVTAVVKMSAEAQEATANANTVAATSDKTAQAAESGGKAVETAIRQMASIQNTVETLAKEITGLGVRSNEIGQIVETISGIAGQTNLLALNAAIEAARAGEQGRGFAVVAEEVRKLAEQSQEAAKQISDLIGAIQRDTSNAVQAMEAGTREVKTGAELVDNAGIAFREITTLIGQTSIQVRSISDAIHEIAQSSENVLAGAQETQKLSKDTSDQTQSVSAATEEQLASMQEIASSSQALAKRAEELQAVVQKFAI